MKFFGFNLSINTASVFVLGTLCDKEIFDVGVDLEEDIDDDDDDDDDEDEDEVDEDEDLCFDLLFECFLPSLEASFLGRLLGSVDLLGLASKAFCDSFTTLTGVYNSLNVTLMFSSESGSWAMELKLGSDKYPALLLIDNDVEDG